jgi:hypothetical protein
MIDRAYALAYFILRHHDLALRATEDALGRLDVAMASQDKRLYYDRAHRDRESSRGKVWLGEAHQLQRLIYIACEPYERAREGAAPGGDVTGDDLILSYVKHLVRITVRRNAFHVLVGVCRLLFNYPTADAMEIQNQLVDHPDDVKDDSYYRARKALLMEELSERFGDLLTVVRQQRGEERFLSVDDSRPDWPFVALCLDRFAPWDTPCWAEASCAASDRELRRIHATLHASCLERLVAGLRLDGPATRLALPRFRVPRPGNEDDMNQDRRPPSELAPSERQRIEASLDRGSRARSRAAAGALRIVVDGRDQGRLDPALSHAFSLSVPEGAEILEVWSEDAGTGTLLAAALLANEGTPASLSITLEAGQHLTARVSGTGSVAAPPVGRRIEITYRETRPGRALLLASRRAGHRLLATMRPQGHGRRLGWSTLALMLVGTAALELGRRRDDALDLPPAAPPVADVRPSPADGLRAQSGPPRAAAVSDVRHVHKVYVEITGDKAMRPAAALSFAAGLRSRRFTVLSEKDRADAVLKVDVKPARGAAGGTPDPASPPVRVVARLVNEDGDILWPAGLLRGGREVEGPLGTCVENILRELLNDATGAATPPPLHDKH